MTTSIRKYTMKAASLSVFAVLGLFFTGCLDSDPVEQTPVAFATFYHGSPNSPGLNIRVDETQINTTSFNYKDYSEYLNFNVGERDFTFTIPNSTTEIASTTVTLEDSEFYSIFLVGEQADAEIVVINDVPIEPSTEKAYVRIINLSHDAGLVDFNVEGVATALATNLPFKGIIPFQYVTSGQLDLTIIDSETDEVVAELENTTLTAGKYYTLILRGYRTPPEENTNVIGAQLVEN